MGRKELKRGSRSKKTWGSMHTAAMGAVGSVLIIALSYLFSEYPGQDLFDVAKNGNEAGVRKLLAAGSNPDLQHPWWNARLQRSVSDEPTAMMAAAQKGAAGTILALIEFGADVNLGNNNGQTALYYSVAGSHEEATLALLDAGADFDVQNDKGSSPLMTACQHGKVGMVTLLLQRGANPDLGMFSTAVMRKELTSINDGLGGETALMLAVRAKSEQPASLEVVKLLLAHGASVNTQDHGGRSALMHAVAAKHATAMELLLEFGANVNLQTHGGSTALDALGMHKQFLGPAFSAAFVRRMTRRLQPTELLAQLGQ